MLAVVDESEAVGVLEDACEDPNTVDCSPLDVEDDELEHEAEEESDRPRGIRDPGRPSPAEVVARLDPYSRQTMVQTLREGQG